MSRKILSSKENISSKRMIEKNDKKHFREKKNSKSDLQ
jgi:hypothetical protein